MAQQETALKRAEIWLTDFNPAKDGEIGKLRPAIILSDDDAIELLATVIVIPLSTVLMEDAKPYRIRITKRENLDQDSDACVNEIRALSKIRLKEKVGVLSEEEYSEIKACVCKLL